VVIGVFDGSGEVLDCVTESLQGEDVAYGVGALVCWAVDRVCGAGSALIVGNCCPTFETVA
jgi:hypothetical protein